jgi:3-oxoacyl-[acyl-carrier-protein] synthase-1
MVPLPAREAYPITAFSAVNALGSDLAAIGAALRAGRTGLAPCAFPLPFETWAGALAASLPAPPAALRPYDSRQCRMALLALEELAAAARRAVRRWGAARVAIVAATSTGGILETERAFALDRRTGALPGGFDFDAMQSFPGIVEPVRFVTGADGPALVVSTACSSSGKAFASARRLLRSGAADAVVVGGVDTLCDTTLRGFGSLQALARGPCRPFGAGRDGLTVGEGGGFALLEREGDAAVWFLGAGESSDAHHMSHPHPEGIGARLAMEAALRQAALGPGDLDLVNAHGTGTPANDVVEADAVAAVLGEAARTVPVVSTKGYTGHLLGAAGVTEAVLSALSVVHGFVPASLGADPLDPGVRLRVPTALEARPVRRVLSNSFAFGGSNVSLVLGVRA